VEMVVRAAMLMFPVLGEKRGWTRTTRKTTVDVVYSYYYQTVNWISESILQYNDHIKLRGSYLTISV